LRAPAAFRFEGETIVWILASDSVGKAELAVTENTGRRGQPLALSRLRD
jgi:hypothetical protein